MLRRCFRGFILLFLASLIGAESPSIVNVIDLGARSDGTDAVQTTAAFLKAFASNPAGEVVVPAGSYLLDNSSGAIVVHDFNGQLSFKGSALLVFTANTKGGMWFIGGTGARVQGLRATYQSAPTRRNSPEEEIKFSDTIDTSVSDISVSNSPAAGVLFYNCIRPKVTNAVIRDTWADGLHFANCQDSQATNVTAINTGDDGLAFVNYAAGPNNTGGAAYNVTVRDSQSRGIAVVGQSNVTISNFSVDDTASSGLLCAYDSAYNTRKPANVLFSSGTVSNAGKPNKPIGNNYGIEYDGQVSCSFSDIQVTGSAGRGLAGMSPDGSVSVANVRISQNREGDAFSFFKTSQVRVSGSSADTAPGYGFFFGQCGTVVATGLSARNSGQSGSLHRAIWFEDNHSIAASGLTVLDTQTQPTGFIVGSYDSSDGSQSGVINGITSGIDHGSLSIQNQSRNLRLQNVSTQ